MKLLIRSDGTGRNTRVVLALDDGTELVLPGVRALSWELAEPHGVAIARFEARASLDGEVELEPPLPRLDVDLTHVCGWVCPACGSRESGNGFKASSRPCDATDCPARGTPRVLVDVPVRSLPQGLVHMDSCLHRPERYPALLAKKLRSDRRIDVGANEAACSMHNAKVLIALACAQADHDFAAGRLDLTAVNQTNTTSADQFFGIVRYHLDPSEGLGALDA